MCVSFFLDGIKINVNRWKRAIINSVHCVRACSCGIICIICSRWNFQRNQKKKKMPVRYAQSSWQRPTKTGRSIIYRDIYMYTNTHIQSQIYTHVYLYVYTACSISPILHALNTFLCGKWIFSNFRLFQLYTIYRQINLIRWHNFQIFNIPSKCTVYSGVRK